MWEFIVAIVPLILLVMKEFFSESARAREANRVYRLSREELRRLVNVALEKQLARMASDSAGADAGWEAADGQARKPDSR